MANAELLAKVSWQLLCGDPENMQRSNQAVPFQIAALAALVTSVVAIAGETPPRPEPRVLLPTADQHVVTWRYTFAEPAADWFKADFNDSAWKEGAAGFGTRGTPNAVLGTVWNTPDVWLRTAFDYDGADFKTAAVRIYHDEDATVHLNGEAILKATWYITEYELVDATPAVRNALHRGRNVLAVRCHQTDGDPFAAARTGIWTSAYFIRKGMNGALWASTRGGPAGCHSACACSHARSWATDSWKLLAEYIPLRATETTWSGGSSVTRDPLSARRSA
jgi:hypothetical protein